MWKPQEAVERQAPPGSKQRTVVMSEVIRALEKRSWRQLEALTRVPHGTLARMFVGKSRVLFIQGLRLSNALGLSPWVLAAFFDQVRRTRKMGGLLRPALRRTRKATVDRDPGVLPEQPGPVSGEAGVGAEAGKLPDPAMAEPAQTRHHPSLSRHEAIEILERLPWNHPLRLGR